LILAAGTSGEWIPRVFAASGASGFDLAFPSPTTSPVLQVGPDIAVRNATGLAVTLGTPTPSSLYMLAVPAGVPQCLSGVVLAPLAICYVKLVSVGGPVNQAPVVNAGPNQRITLPATATLSGSATDDGLPNPPGALTFAWTKVSGPGTVNFGNAASATTSASFSVAGTYVLRLTVSDSALAGSADVTITVNPVAAVNQPPVVNAGPNQTITLPATATLAGTATDDGLPNPPGALTYHWTQDSGPVSAVIANPR
jgi:hypothetical protein